jgi:hypothetical protein
LSRMSELQYPEQPGFKVSGPSEQAALAVAPVAKNLRDQVKQAIAAAPNGLTADEIASKLNRTPFSVRPRVSELRRLGEICQAATRGKNSSGMSASVWVVSSSIAGGEAHE